MDRIQKINRHLDGTKTLKLNNVAGVRVGGSVDVEEIKRRVMSWNSYLDNIVPNKILKWQEEKSSILSLPLAEWTRGQYDLIVVGFGAAGASAALDAADQGLQVLLVDRFDGGGSTRRSGGVYYAGGGTTAQKDLGVEDDVETMFQYIKRENGGAVDDQTIRDFCNQSPQTFEWLEKRVGIPFKTPSGQRKLYSVKTSYPPSDTTLYQSGNESVYGNPIPRGNRAYGDYLTGNIFFGALEKAVETHKNITIVHHCKAIELKMSNSNTCNGIVVRALPDRPDLKGMHVMLHEIGSGSPMFDPKRKMDNLCREHERTIFDEFGHEMVLSSSCGVVLSCGGFYFNQELVEKYAVHHPGYMPLGNLGDDGCAHAMGLLAGADLDRMDRCSAWKFINPPLSFVSGVLVNSDGERVGREDVYGATFADFLIRNHRGKGWLIIDQDMWNQANQDCMDPESGLQEDQRMQGLANLHRGNKNSDSIHGLSELTGMNENKLQVTLRKYNESALMGVDHEFQKSKKYLKPLDLSGKLYAINLDMVGNKYWPTPCMTLGGLKVEGSSGRVICASNSKPIDGLYAAGRSAVGIASNYYVSGLSLADCVFSGRRAGSHAAKQYKASSFPNQVYT